MPHMTPEQKEAMRQMMGGAMANIESMTNAPPVDIEAVRPHLDALNQAMEN